MGMLVDGQWTTQGYAPDGKGRFVRPTTRFRDRVTADGSSGFPAEAGRYHLYVSYACPWAHRTLLLRKLEGLEDAIGISVVDWEMTDEGWRFDASVPGATPDALGGARFLREVYTRARPDFTGRVTVPVLWDTRTGTIVNNESREIARMLETEFDAFGNPEVNFFPPALGEEIEATIEAIYAPINDGVYRAGFASSQEAYDEAVGELFAALDRWDAHLATRRYLCGDRITEADWFLFTTLVRFDPVYHTHFKCNLRRIEDYPHLSGYLRDLYQVPGVAETVRMDHIKGHYFASHRQLNPTGIVPVGDGQDLTSPHDRAQLAKEIS